MLGVICIAHAVWMPRPAWAVLVTGTPVSEVKRYAYAGDPQAEATVGYWHYCGFGGFARNLTVAREWYLKAALKGSARARAAVGELYEFGEGIRQDHQQALMWVRKAMTTGDNGNPSGALIIALRYDTGERPMVSEQCHSKVPRRDPTKAIEWYRLAAETGDGWAQTNMAKLYESDPAVLNMEEAVRWYLAAADDWAPAAGNLARLYLTGTGVPQDYAEAAKWYAKAVKIDGHTGRYELGLLYEQGLGVTEDRDRAMELYYGAAVQNADAQRRLLKLYEADLPLPSELNEVISWYEATAEQGNRRALVGLGLHYQFGNGVQNNLFVARALYAVAQQSPGKPSDIPNFIEPMYTHYSVMDDIVQALVRQMAQPGNLRAAIESFIEHPPQVPDIFD